MNAGVVVVAAGLGTRLGAGMPKALVSLGDAPLVVHAVRRMIAVGGVSHVVVVSPATHASEFAESLQTITGDARRRGVIVDVVDGGAERSDSVRAGLTALNRECDLVLVHDAARCLAPSWLAQRVLDTLAAGADAVVPALAVSDTIKVVESADALGPSVETVVATPPRASLRAVQTPQGFRRSALVAAHESQLDATDDAALIEKLGQDVRVVEGEAAALKVTTPLDMLIAEQLLREQPD